MSELFWDENFEWLDLPPLTNEEYRQLSLEEYQKREEIIAEFLGVYTKRYVLVNNSSIVASGATLNELIHRGKEGDPFFVEDFDGAAILSQELS